jgi:putative ABC transport system permease protein
MDVSLAPRRFSSVLVGGFAAVALLLASIGIYGLLAYMVGQRTHEIGVRVALGAQPSDILTLILRRGVLFSSAGILAGLFLAAIAAPLMASLLYGVRPIDPLVFLVVPAVFLVVAVLASLVPARRAMNVDPIVALREN